LGETEEQKTREGKISADEFHTGVDDGQSVVVSWLVLLERLLEGVGPPRGVSRLRRDDGNLIAIVAVVEVVDVGGTRLSETENAIPYPDHAFSTSEATVDAENNVFCGFERATSDSHGEIWIDMERWGESGERSESVSSLRSGTTSVKSTTQEMSDRGKIDRTWVAIGAC